MDVFIIHSHNDYNEINNIISFLKSKVYSFNILILKKRNFFWKLEASKKIKKSHMVLFIVGKNSYKSPYISWEIKKAIKCRKLIYIIKLQEDYQLPTSLFIEDEISKKRKNYGTILPKSEFINIIQNYNTKDYGLFNTDSNEYNQDALLEQYKMFVQTSEDLVNRRQTVNSFYLSISSALVTIMSVFLALSFGKKLKMIIGLVFCIIGIVLSISWFKILVCYGNLNSSKMKIISNIEKNYLYLCLMQNGQRYRTN